MKHVLLVGSKSPSRQELLAEANIPFELVEQNADETACDWGLSLAQSVERIALYKMEHVIMPVGTEGEVRFVLTADTLSQSRDGSLHGKPLGREDAIAKIIAAREGTRLCTAFCLSKRAFHDSQWHVAEQITHVVCADFIFNIPDAWIERYLEESCCLETAGAIAVEGFGNQFLKMVDGSYSAIMGLPMVEVREGLQEIGFFSDTMEFDKIKEPA